MNPGNTFDFLYKSLFSILILVFSHFVQHQSYTNIEITIHFSTIVMPFITSPSGRSIEQPISARLSVTQSCLFFRLLPQELRDEIHIAVLMNDSVYHREPGTISVLPQGDPLEKVLKSSWSSTTFKVKNSESDFGWLASCRDNHYEVSRLYFRYKRFYFADSNILANLRLI